MQNITLTDTYQKVTPAGTGICIGQGHGVKLYLGTSVPSADAPAIYLKDNYPIPIDVTKFTQIYVKGYGTFRFAG